ncbi:MAG TPA: 5'-3' exonuclease H3TH domain-containing protein [Thermoanaerobaculia bacterium]|nr:5'-3' exonuclease H3TH domain-containing protein [Thermoanaerobaculia bacterium]
MKSPVIVHLVDGTYELFRHFYGARHATNGVDSRFGGVRGVLRGVLEMIEKGATHIGVATDHVIESFRNELWDGYKTGAGIDPVLWSQFHPLEDGLAAMGVAVWPMIELEADDGLASAAFLASADASVQKICIWTPDKDLAQCVVGDRIVQIDGRRNVIRDAAGVEAKFGVPPALIPDYLALVGDAADGYPGIRGFGPKRAAAILRQRGPIEAIDDRAIDRERALLFKKLATLRTDAMLFDSVGELRWSGPSPSFAAFAETIGAPELAARAQRLAPV